LNACVEDAACRPQRRCFARSAPLAV